METDIKDLIIKFTLSSIVYIISIVIIMFFVGVSRVDAQSLTWNNPTYISLNNGNPGFNIIAQVDNGSSVGIVGNGAFNAKNAWAIYQVNKNNINNSYQTLDKSSYSISFQAVVELTASNTPLQIVIFDNGTQYVGTCDAGLNQENSNYIVSTGFGNVRLTRVKYTCNRINVNLDNVSYISIGLHSQQYDINYFAIESNLVLIDLNDTSADTDKIVANNNKNTQDIINTITNSQNNTNEKLENIENSITDESAPDLDALENSAGWLPPGPVDSILNLPLSLFNNLVDNLSNSCQSVNIELPYIKKTLVLPCINTIYEQIGVQDFINWVGLVAGSLILFSYLINLYKWVDATLSFRENNWPDWGGV